MTALHSPTCERGAGLKSPSGAAAARYFEGTGTDLGHVTALPQTTFADLVTEVISRSNTLAITRAEYAAMPKKERDKAKRSRFITPAAFTAPSSRRQTDCATCCNLIAIDVDDPVEAKKLLKHDWNGLDGYAFVVWHTASSTPDAPRLRIIVSAEGLPLARYPDAVRGVGARLGMSKVTTESTIPVQPMYLPVSFRSERAAPIVFQQREGFPYGTLDLFEDDERNTESPAGVSGDVADLDHLRLPEDGVSLEDASDMLRHISADLKRDEWVRVAMSLRHQFQQDPESGFRLYDGWSATGGKYEGSADTRAVWDSIEANPKNRAPVTIQTLRKMAVSGGWVGNKENGGGEGWTVVTADKLCSEPPPTPPELIHGVLYRGGTMMLSGPSKSRKTYTMLAAAQAIATGSKWLGFETTATPVLYLNLELQDFAVSRRIRDIAGALASEPSPDVHLANLRGRMVSLDKLTANVGRLLKETGAGLVIVDPHYKVSAASGVEENSNDEQAAFLYAIESICNSGGAAVMIAHHFAKGDASMKRAIDRAAGGGALARWPDVVMTLTEHDTAECMTAEFALRNFAPVAPFVVRWSLPVWQRADDLNPAQLKRSAGRSDEHPAEEALHKLGDERLTRTAWAHRLGWSESTFRRKLDQLLAEKKVGLKDGQYYKL